MGLDMYLYKRTNIPYKEQEKLEVTIRGTEQDSPLNKINSKQLVAFEEKVGYWRKANAIHRFFIEECADGRDECQDIYVDYGQLKTLYETCKNILEDKTNIISITLPDGSTLSTFKDDYLAKKLLPTQEGFFFGSTEYGDDYITDLEDTISILKPIVEEGSDFYIDYIYRASW